MDLITLVFILIVIGVVLLVINKYVPMDANIKNIMNVVVILGVILWVLRILGVFKFLPHIQVGF